MITTRYLIIIIFLFATIIVVFGFLRTQEVRFVVTQDAKDGQTISTSIDRFTTSHSLPKTINLRPGRYEYFFSGPGNNFVRSEFRVGFFDAGQTITITPTPFLDSRRIEQQRTLTHDEWEELRINPYVSLLPRITPSYSIHANLRQTEGNNEPIVESLIITPFVAVGPEDTKQDLRKIRDDYVNRAMTWLKENNLYQEDILIIIDSVF